METKSSEDIFLLVSPDTDLELELLPKWYKVIERNEDDIVDSIDGWTMLPEDSSLYTDEEFLHFLNCSLDSIRNETSVILESKHYGFQNVCLEVSFFRRH